MTSGPTQSLITVLSGGSTTIHLASSEEVDARHQPEPMTLCREPVESRISTQRFHRLGCPACAGEAVRTGVTSIVDRRQTAVNLPRFLAALRPAVIPAAPSTPVVPRQRGRLEG